MTGWRRDGSCLCETAELHDVLRAPTADFVAAGAEPGDIEDIKLAASLAVLARLRHDIGAERRILEAIPLCDVCAGHRRGGMTGPPPQHCCFTPEISQPDTACITLCRWGRRGRDVSAIEYLARNVHGAWQRRSMGHWPGINISTGRASKR